MTRTEARYTAPLTVTVRPDELGLWSAYAKSNSLTLTELIRECMARQLGVADERGNVTIGDGFYGFEVPKTREVVYAVARERERGLALLARKRARQGSK